MRKLLLSSINQGDLPGDVAVRLTLQAAGELVTGVSRELPARYCDERSDRRRLPKAAAAEPASSQSATLCSA